MLKNIKDVLGCVIQEAGLRSGYLGLCQKAAKVLLTT